MRTAQKPGNFLKHLAEVKMAHNKSHNISGVSKMKEYDKIMGALEFSAQMQKSDGKEYSNSSVATSKNFGEDIDSPTFEKMIKPKKSRLSHHKIEAFKRAEKTKFENIRNLLGLDMDLCQVLSPSLTPKEEEVIKLHREINERVQTYEKQNRKLGWQVEEINEKVNEQITLRDKMVSKYTNIFQNTEQKLADMELNKRQTTKLKEDEMREKAKKMHTKIQGTFNTGINFMQTKCDSIKNLVTSSEDYISKIKDNHTKKKEGFKIVENEYLTRQYRENYKHKKKLSEIRDNGQKLIKQYQEPEDKYEEPPERIQQKETMKSNIKIMQSRPKPKLDKTQMSYFTTLNSYQSKISKNKNLPQMHIPFKVRRNQLTRDNSQFLHKVIKKKKIKMAKNEGSSSTNAFDLKCMLDTLNPKHSNGLLSTPSKSVSQSNLRINTRKNTSNFSPRDVFTPILSQNPGYFHRKRLSL